MPYSGFGYPLYGLFSTLNPGKPLSAPNALELFPSELFSPWRIEGPFQILSPLLSFTQKPVRLPGCFSAISSSPRAVPLFATQRVSSGQGRLLSGAFNLPGSPPLDPLPKSLSSLRLPLSFFSPYLLTKIICREPQGFSGDLKLGSLPP